MQRGCIKAGATDAVPETLESSLQLSEAMLVDLGVAMGPVIASIHEKRDEFRAAIKEAGELDEGAKLEALQLNRKRCLDRSPAPPAPDRSSRTAALRHFWPATAALPAHRRGCSANQIGAL